jgi:hypothetical protein
MLISASGPPPHEQRSSLGLGRTSPWQCRMLWPELRTHAHIHPICDYVLQIVNESLPIFLDSAIGGGVAAVLISTAMIGTRFPSL